MRTVLALVLCLALTTLSGCSDECARCPGETPCDAAADAAALPDVAPPPADGASDDARMPDVAEHPADAAVGDDVTGSDAAAAPEDATDPAPLAVVNVIPDDGETAVAVDASIVVAFTAPVRPETVTDERLRVEVEGEAVAGQLLSDGRAVIFVPALLLPATTYTVVVTPGIASIDGATLEDRFSSTFTTGTTLSTGAPGPETFEPVFLPRGFHRLTRRAELLVVGDDFANIDADLSLMDPALTDLRDDREHAEPFDRLADDADTAAWGPALTKTGAVGNLDDDPREDAAIISTPDAGPGVLRVVRAVGAREAAPTLETIPVAVDLSVFPEGGSAEEVAAVAHRYEVVSGNLDDDGADEIVVLGRAAGLARLWVLDGAAADGAGGAPEFATRWTTLLDAAGPVTSASVAVGDLDGDNRQEIVVAHLNDPLATTVRIHLRVLGDTGDDFAERHEASVDSPRAWLPAVGQHDLALRTGDLDGAFGDELVVAEFAGQWVNDETSMDARWGFVALRLGETGLEELHRYGHQPCNGRVHPYRRKRNDAAFFFELADVDGNGVHEVYLNDWLYDNATGAGLGRCPDGAACVASDGPFAPLHALPTYYKREALAVGDFDGDGADDLAFFGMEKEPYRDAMVAECGAQQPTPTDQSFHSFQERKVFDAVAEELDSVWEWHQLDVETFGGPTNNLDARTFVLGVDADFDSTVIAPDAGAAEDDAARKADRRYGGVEQVFHDNVIIAAIAGPPCHEQMGQYLPACSTGLGVRVGATVETGSAVTVTASVWVGVEVETQVGAGLGPTATATALKARIGLKSYWAASVYASTTATRSQTITTYAGAGEDLVIFTSLPHNRYRYTVVSVDVGEENPDEAVGETIVVDVPLGPRILAVSRDYYNRTNGSQRDVGDDVLPGDPGDLDTYPSLALAETIMNAGLPLGISTPIWVSEGGGYQEIALEFSLAATVGGSLTVGVETEAENCVATVCLGVTAGLEATSYLQFSLESGTVVSGAVSALSSDKYAEYLFSFGLYAYLRSGLVNDGTVRAPFTVIGYYVNH